ncbi:MAG: hypothetical protein PHH68_06325 [Candidatus Omnitrophica bacterium]|jgi:hypothetical protein|nr:hypothetical protein [Candidatus Omnitrophota bacterium]MDD5079922.1 hypothetical protein [Candidatus Omnitrophota bacterium]
MAKRGFLKDEGSNIDFGQLDPGLDAGGDIKPKFRLILDKVLSIFKLAVGISLLCFVYSYSMTFLKELGLADKAMQEYFWSGIGAFVVIHFFVYELSIVYNKGQKILMLVFKFFAPLVKVAPYVLPIYTIIIFCVYPLFNLFWGSKGLTGLFIALGSFSLCLHLVFGAKSLRSKQGDFLKANYIFGFSLVYILNLILLAFCLSLIVEKFSFVTYFNASFQTATHIFQAVFNQIFIPK